MSELNQHVDDTFEADFDACVMDQADLSRTCYRLLDDDGEPVTDDVPGLSEDDLLELYEWMLFQRRFDERAIALQRRGELGTYPPATGQEASVVGSAFALESEDWFYPAAREFVGQIMNGVSVRDIVLYWRGVEDANLMEGARMNIMPIPIKIGSQLPVAVGISRGMDLSESEGVTAIFMGDGATSTGGFHEGFNFAGILDVPAVFFCQNNQYAISVPIYKQTGANTLAQKALGYGLQGIRVDGNDVLAVYDAFRKARERALEGQPVFIEALTYRIDAHTTSDDDSLYRDSEEIEYWKSLDPIDRFETFLETKDLIDEETRDELLADINERIEEGIEAANEYEKRQVDEMFDHLWEEMPEELERQKAEFKDLLERRPDVLDYVEHRPKG